MVTGTFRSWNLVGLISPMPPHGFYHRNQSADWPILSLGRPELIGMVPFGSARLSRVPRWDGRLMADQRRRIAVVGSGVAGLTAAYILRTAAEVTLYEADHRLGGHAHTHDLVAGSSVFPVDTGFIVHNRRTYPTLLRLFAELGIETRAAEMSMSIRCDGCGLEYAGAKGLRGLFARPTNALRGRYLALLAQVPRFHRQARALLADGRAASDPGPTLGEFVSAHGFSTYFVQHFVVPLVSAVWSCGPHRVAEYPARYLFRFLDHHGMLTVSGSPTWRTVVGGSRRYVEAAVKNLSAVRTSTPVRSIVRAAGGVLVRDDADLVEPFDGVVIATHPDQALRLLADPTPLEREVLGAFTYSRNETVLHTDRALLPRRGAARACWNYHLPACSPPAGAAQLSYDLNRLQGLRSPARFILTLNARDAIARSSVRARIGYEHPIYTSAVIDAQRRLPELSTMVTAFAGAYHGWGFHEDGCRSGVDAARALGVAW
jgi:predicted NAD/FAD-binding protein